jgi:hypothetical protein
MDAPRKSRGLRHWLRGNVGASSSVRAAVRRAVDADNLAAPRVRFLEALELIRASAQNARTAALAVADALDPPDSPTVRGALLLADAALGGPAASQHFYTAAHVFVYGVARVADTRLSPDAALAKRLLDQWSARYQLIAEQLPQTSTTQRASPHSSASSVPAVELDSLPIVRHQTPARRPASPSRRRAYTFDGKDEHQHQHHELQCGRIVDDQYSDSEDASAPVVNKMFEDESFLKRLRKLTAELEELHNVDHMGLNHSEVLIIRGEMESALPRLLSMLDSPQMSSSLRREASEVNSLIVGLLQSCSDRHCRSLSSSASFHESAGGSPSLNALQSPQIQRNQAHPATLRTHAVPTLTLSHISSTADALSSQEAVSSLGHGLQDAIKLGAISPAQRDLLISIHRSSVRQCELSYNDACEQPWWEAPACHFVVDAVAREVNPVPSVEQARFHALYEPPRAEPEDSSD